MAGEGEERQPRSAATADGGAQSPGQRDCAEARPGAEPLTEEDLEVLGERIEKGEEEVEVPEEATREGLSGRVNMYALVKEMTVGQRLKLALHGNRSARAVLVRDRVSLVRRFVLKNPRITDEEIIALAKNRNLDTELLKLIARRREWVKKYPVRLALVTNPKTPPGIALSLVGTLQMRDLRQLAKSKNVPSAISKVAKRYVLRQSGERV